MDEAARPDSHSDRGFTFVALVTPFAFAVWRATGGAQWQSDLAAVRDHGFAAVGLGGVVSTTLSQILTLLPLGGLAFRAALGAAVALAIASWMLFRITRRVLATTDAAPWIVSLLATVAALTASLGPTMQGQATLGGGACVATAICLWGIDLLMRLTAPTMRVLKPEATSGWLQLAVLCGFALAENVPCGIALVVVTALSALSARRRPPLRLAVAAALVAVGIALLLTVSVALRPLAPRSWRDVGHALSALNLASLDMANAGHAALAAWWHEVGPVSLVAATIGVVAGLVSAQRRVAVGAFAALVLVDLLYPLAAVSLAAADPLAGLRSLSVAAFAFAAALGVLTVVVFLRQLEVPMARTAAVLSLVFHITVVAVTCEEAAFVADRSDHHAAEDWTSEALGRLPPNSAVLVHSPQLTWRLWAAQTMAQQRPDVLVVSAPLLKRGQVAAHLVPSEPNVTYLLRDFALTGQASEYALSILADSRPLMVELDRAWKKRILTHLHVAGPWLRYAPQTLGRSDLQRASHHVDLAGLVPSPHPGMNGMREPTAQVIAKTLKEHVAAMSLVGFAEVAQPWLEDVAKLTPEDAFVVGARLRFFHAQRSGRMHRAVELRDLLPF